MAAASASDYMPKRTSDTIVFTLGKFNPPHEGHEILGKQVREFADANDADPVIFVSDKTNKFDGLASKKGLLDLMSKIRTGNLNRNDMHEKQAIDMDEKEFIDRINQDDEGKRKYVNLPGENDTPLTGEFKLYLLKEIYRNNKIIQPENVLLAKGGIGGIPARISKAGYKNIILVVGSDRVVHFRKVLVPMAPKFNLNLLKVVTDGEEREEKGVSGTLLRYLANEAFDELPDGELLKNVIGTTAGIKFKELTKYPEISISDPKLLAKFDLPEAMDLTAAAMYQIRNRIPRGGKKGNKQKKGKKTKRRKSKRRKSKRKKSTHRKSRKKGKKVKTKRR